MEQALMTEPKRIEFREAPVPEPREGEALMEIARIGVCGSDIHVYHGQIDHDPGRTMKVIIRVN